MAVNVLNRSRFFGNEYLVVDADPSTSSGVSAGARSLAIGPTAIVYEKTGPADTAWVVVAAPSSGSGTVTSVAQTVPAEFAIAGSPITGAGTLAITKANQNANQVWAGPTTGVPAQPTFRALVAADIPNVATTTKAANYAMAATDGTIFCDTSGGAFTLTLPSPAAAGAGKIYRIIDTKGTFNSNNLSLAPNGAEKISGLAATKVLQTAWGFFTVTTDGTDWYVG